MQSRKNLLFAERPFLEALERHGKLRPPLYPVLLWAGARLGLPPARVNEVLYLLVLAGVLVYLRRELPEVGAVWPLLLLLLAHFNYVNLYQPVAETLFVLLSLVVVLGLLSYQRTGSRGALVIMTGSTAALGFTRYFALFSVFPLVGLELLRRSPLAWRRRLALAAGCLAAAAVPAALWMGLAYHETGFLTGADRTLARSLPEPVRHWEELTGLGSHLWLSLKTLAIDFFSVREHASLAVVTRSYAPGPAHWLGTFLLVACAAAAFAVTVRRKGRANVGPAVASGQRRGARLLAEYVALYYAATLALWTIGNNDPINTRFLYPSYVFLALLGFHAYAWVKANAGAFWLRLPFHALYALLVAVQAWRSYQAVPLPIR